MQLTPGQEFSDYRVLERLGGGAMGAVYRAQHPRFGQVALKLMGSHAPRQRFELESQSLASLVHPGLPRHLDAGDEPWPFFAQELVEGTRLSSRLASPASDGISLTVSLLEVLEYLHSSGWIHRDLKPDNMIVRENRIVLLDLGIVRELEREAALTTSGELVGTPAYMAPEQINSDLGEVGPRTDLFVVTTLLYELVTGNLPFAGSLPRILMRIASPTPLEPVGLEGPLAQICLRGWEKNPEKRFSSAREFRDALRDL